MNKTFWTAILLCSTIVTWGQRTIDIPSENAQIEEEIKSLTTQLKLKDLKITIGKNFRVWFFNDLAITIMRDNGQEGVVVTCYYEKEVNGTKAVSEYKDYVVPRSLATTICTEFDRLNLREWKNDFEVKDYPLKHSFGYVNAYEYTDTETYRIIKYYTPGLATNTGEGKRAIELKNFLERNLNLNKYRIDFLEKLEQPDKSSKKMLRLLRGLSSKQAADNG